MASSALHLPSVEKALAMSSGGSGSAPDTSSTDNSNVTSSHTRKDSARLGEATEKFTRLSSRKVKRRLIHAPCFLCANAVLGL